MHNQWLMRFHNRPYTNNRLICFNYGGGGPSAFRDWHHFLPDNTDLVCIQLPGRENRFKEPLLTDLSAVISALKPVVSSILNVPCVFFGHSLGALIAHNLLSALDGDGCTSVKHLVVSGRHAPSDHNQYYENITHLPDKEFLIKLQEYGGTPTALLENKQLMEIYLPILRADFILADSPAITSGQISCPISVFGGLDDKIEESMLKLWGHETCNTCVVNTFPGDHFFLHQSKQQVLDCLKGIISSITP